MRWWLVLASVAQWVWCCTGYHVLVVYPAPTHSHNTLGRGMVDALLQAGHEVSWVTPYPPAEKTKGLNIIDVSSVQAVFAALDTNYITKLAADLSFIREMTRNISMTATQTPAFRDALVKGQFDAVITEYFFSDSDAGYAALLKVPWILMSSVTMEPNFEMQVDELRTLSTVPMFYNPSPTPMSFWKRLLNTGFFAMITASEWLEYSNLVRFYEKRFAPLAAARGTTLPSFEDAFYNVSILFLNSHPCFSPATILPPNVIEIGGYHLKDEVPPLPKDLQDLFDSSSRGVMYFSMGSVVKSANFPAATQRELLQMFGELPYTVLWKFEGKLDNIPSNVHIRPWMPQASILAHPNVKVFITHGGMLSTLEALHNGVPLLAVPVFGDQPANADTAAQAGFARRVDFSPDMTPELKAALLDMLSDESFSKKAKYMSKLCRTRPVPPKKLIAHYVELAIESEGAYHLRSKSQLYAWYQRWMLDQLAALLLLLALLYAAARALLTICCNRIWGNKTIKLKKQKKN